MLDERIRLGEEARGRIQGGVATCPYEGILLSEDVAIVGPF